MRSRTPAAAVALAARFEELRLTESIGGDLLDPVLMGAVVSEETPALYRYMLWRVFDPDLPILVAVMLNPSTADHERDDPTIRGLVARARLMGYGGVLVVNCFALRATDPRDMLAHEAPVGARNDAAIRAAMPDKDGMVLCAWGAHATRSGRQEEVACLIRESGCRPHALKLCANGAPAHPLYIAHTILPSEWHAICPNS